VALQLIFAALGPFSGMRKSNLDLLLLDIWPKTVNKSIKKNKKISCFADIVNLSSFILNSAGCDEK